MADPRFFSIAGPLSLADIAAIAGAELMKGTAPDPARLVRDVAPLDRAGADDIGFLDNVKYIDTFATSRAGACFIRHKYASRAPAGMALLLSDEPYRCYALTAQRFYPVNAPVGIISPLAVIARDAKLGKNCTVEAGAVIAARAEIGDDCHIGAGVMVHSGVMIGEGSHIGANTTLSHCIIGKRAILHRGVHVGQDGFGFALGRTGHIKVPQLGRVIIEDDVEIGSGTCIDRGTGPDTFIGEGTKIDNLVQIAHNVHIGKHSVLAAQVGIAGSSRVGDGVMMGGQVGISGHVKVGPGVRLAAQSGVITDVPPAASYGGTPAVPIKDWHRQTVSLARLVKRKGSENE